MIFDFDIEWFDVGFDAGDEALQALAEMESTDGFDPKNVPPQNDKILSKPEMPSQQSLRRAGALDKEFWDAI